MSFVQALPNHLRPRREKLFGDGRPQSLDRNAKIRIKVYARALSRRTEKGKHYGALTAKALDVLDALLWHFHNARSGLCFPSYETIAERAGCARSTVAEAIKALEEAGILTWVNRITRVTERCRDLFGNFGLRVRLIRISNAYQFRDPNPGGAKAGQSEGSSKSEIRSGLLNQDSSLDTQAKNPRVLDPENPLDSALLRLGHALGAVV